MCEIDYEAAGMLGTIATLSYCITQASNTGIIFECHNWLNSFEVRVFPNKNNLDHFFYLDEQGNVSSAVSNSWCPKINIEFAQREEY